MLYLVQVTLTLRESWCSFYVDVEVCLPTSVETTFGGICLFCYRFDVTVDLTKANQAITQNRDGQTKNKHVPDLYNFMYMVSDIKVEKKLV